MFLGECIIFVLFFFFPEDLTGAVFFLFFPDLVTGPERSGEAPSSSSGWQGSSSSWGGGTASVASALGVWKSDSVDSADSLLDMEHPGQSVSTADCGEGAVPR